MLTHEKIRQQCLLKTYQEAFAAAVHVHVRICTEATLEALKAAGKQLRAVEDAANMV